MTLNARALRLVEAMLKVADARQVAAQPIERGGRLIDCGIEAHGGLAAGLDLARICLADLAEVSLVPGEVAGRPCPHVQVVTDHPVRACLASQYAGWAIQEEKFFAMGSGPMRAAAGREALFDVIDEREGPDAVVGVLESRKRPGTAVVARIASACRVPPAAVTLLVAPTASLAGTLQVVARSVETAMHKLHELGFDVRRVRSAYGSAPLPPVARDDLAAIGRTNDAVLYGARVVLHVTGDDASLEAIGPNVPSSASRDHGATFAEIFKRYDHDFYAVDPHLFSPAQVALHNLETGKVWVHGALAPEVLEASFYGP